MGPAGAPLLPLTVDGLRRIVAQRLESGWAGLSRQADRSAARDARLIVAHALGVDAGRLTLLADTPVDDAATAAALALAGRRGAGEPIARLFGAKEFWSLELGLSAATLVPRPDTETVVSAALEELAKRGGKSRAHRLLDIGTGSGAILLALLAELPLATGIGTDRALPALRTARDNAGRLGLAGRSAFVCGNWAEMIRGPADAVVANPPYIETGTVASLPEEVRLFDPVLALDGGDDGLAAYRSIIADLPRLLPPHGFAALEVGMGQAGAVASIGRRHGFAARTVCDLAGIERVVVLDRPA